LPISRYIRDFHAGGEAVAQSPEEELSAFLKDLPTYMQKALWYEPMSLQELAEYVHGSGGRALTESDLKFFESRGWQPDKHPLKEEELRKSFVQILRRCNRTEWNRYRKNAKLARAQSADLTIPMPRGNPGRPREDAKVDRAKQLKAEGKSWNEAAQRIHQEFGKEDTTTGENLRSLVKSRKKAAPRKKSRN
jgi:hypothetical protein